LGIEGVHHKTDNNSNNNSDSDSDFPSEDSDSEGESALEDSDEEGYIYDSFMEEVRRLFELLLIA